MSKFGVLYGTNSKFEMKFYIILAKKKPMNGGWLLLETKEILSLLNDSITAGHPGMSRIKHTICSRFYCHI